MKRVLVGLAGVAGVAGIILLAVGVMQGFAVALLVICLVGMGSTVGGAAANSMGD